MTVEGGPMDRKTTLCISCRRSGTSSCAWDKAFEPVAGWTAQRVQWNEAFTYQVSACPLFVPDRDPDNRDNDRLAVQRLQRERGMVMLSAGASNEAVQRKFGVCMATVLNWRRQMEKGSDQNA